MNGAVGEGPSKRCRDKDAGSDADSDVVLISFSSSQHPRPPGASESRSCPRPKKPRTSAIAIDADANSRAIDSGCGKSLGSPSKKGTGTGTKPTKPAPVVEITIEGRKLRTTAVFDMFWRYASSRQDLENRRRAGENQPWTEDPILNGYRFCSVYRFSDAASQFLIREVIEKGSQAAEDVVFRVVLFNIFTRVETYKTLERRLGPLTWRRYDQDKFERALRHIEGSGESLYTGAFQKPAPKLGKDSNYANHLQLLDVLMRKEPNLVHVIENCDYLADAYDWINCLPGMGDFTAHQLLLDLSYAGLGGKGLARFHPSDFVIAGIGAVKGIELCFNGAVRGVETEIMRWMCENQEKMFARLGLTFEGLKSGGKSLPIGLCDIEHTLCEVYKYERLVRNEGAGIGGKARKFTPKHTLESEATVPKAWKNASRKIKRVRPGKVTRVGKEYVVNALLKKRPAESKAGSKGSESVKYEYLVDWLGYGIGDRTWEPEEMLREDAPEMVEEFEKTRKKSKKGD